MVFKNFVKAILLHQRDPSDMTSLHVVNALKGEMANDLIEAYKLSKPLVTANPSLFWTSDSFLDFLIKVMGGPDFKSKCAVPETCGDSPCDPYEMRQKVEELTQKLNECKRDYDRKEVECQDLETKYRECQARSREPSRWQEKESAEYWEKLYRDCRDRLKEAEEHVQDKERCLKEQSKKWERERKEMEERFEETERNAAKKMKCMEKDLVSETEKNKALEDELQRSAATLEREKKEIEQLKHSLKSREEALESCENKLTEWTKKYRSPEAAVDSLSVLPYDLDSMELDISQMDMKESDKIKCLTQTVTKLRRQIHQLMTQTPSHITLNYNTDLSGDRYLSPILNQIRDIVPDESQSIIPQLQEYERRWNHENKRLEWENERLSKELDLIQVTTLSNITERRKEDNEKLGKYPKIMDYLKEMVVIADETTWEDEIVNLLTKKDEALHKFKHGLRKLSSLMSHIHLNESNFVEAISEKLKMNDKDHKENEELYTYINNKHPQWFQTSSWVKDLIQQDTVVTELLLENSLRSVNELKDSFRRLRDTKNEYISFIQKHKDQFDINLEKDSWSEDFLEAVNDLVRFKREMDTHLNDVQATDYCTWLTENAGIYKILIENNITSVNLLLDKMAKFKTLNAIFLKHSVNVQTIDKILQERKDFLNYYRSWCSAYGLAQNTRVEDFDTRISQIPKYYSEWLNILQLDENIPMENFGVELSTLKKETTTWKRSITAELTCKKAKTEDPDQLEDCLRQLDEKSEELRILKEKFIASTSENVLTPSTLKSFFYFLFIRYFKLLYSYIAKDFTNKREYEDTLSLKRDLLKKGPRYRKSKKGRQNSDLVDVLMKYVQYDLEFEFSSDMGEYLPQTEVAFLEKCVEDTTVRIKEFASKIQSPSIE